MDGNVFNSEGRHVAIVRADTILDLTGKEIYKLKGERIYKLSGELVGTPQRGRFKYASRQIGRPLIPGVIAASSEAMKQ